jgi:Condensation domain
MPEAAHISESKRKLLETFLRGRLTRPLLQSAPITPRPAGGPRPLSLAQEQLWYRTQAIDIPLLYNETITLRRTGPLNVLALERSLAEIIRRHEIWRTTYDIVDGTPIQVIHAAPITFRLPIVDLRSLDKEKIEQEALRIAAGEAHRPFDLRRGPLLRVILLRTSDLDYRLSMVAHLSIVDGVSVYQVLPFELSTLYAAFSRGRPSPLPEPSIQYSDYAYWQRERLKGNEKEEQLTYWRQQLAGKLAVLNWPSCPRPAVQSYRGHIRSFTLTWALTNALKELIKSEKVTLFTTLVASFSTLLFHYTRQVDLVIGTPSPSGRKRSEVQGALGYFLNPVPLRIDLDGDPTVRELLLRIQKVAAGAISNDDLPIEVLANDLQVKLDPSRNPFFTVALSVQPKTPDIAAEWRVTSMDAGSGGAVWDLYLAFIDGPGGLSGRAQYNPDLFNSQTISRMLRHLKSVMKAIAADPGRPISNLSLPA